ncbi:hypothetical protein [Massilia orientalis]|uniref:Uncharacterized protein n=1 Tax=Massilia orientalis TaxID=3050128 RepID=A0ACC7MET7_9BURK|nr:hypothetical protein [Massilia sp. YIM B02787]
MTFLNISSKTRASMARRLASFLEEHTRVQIQHTLANKAIAAIFGHNEHSLSAAIKQQGGIKLDELNDGHTVRLGCAVHGCTRDAAVEVRLFDLYERTDGVRIFDQQDYTCPYLCDEHVAENERGAIGTRAPRDITQYPFSNQHRAQGVTTYRPVEKEAISTSGLVDFGEGWTMAAALKDELITGSRRVKDTFYVRVGSLKTEISISLRRGEFGIEFSQSHVIKTPMQIDGYRTSRPWNDTPGSALRQAITGLTQYYNAATRAGHVPDESWLIPY